MRNGRDGEQKMGKKWEKKDKTDENSGHYVIASSRPPERRPLERRTLSPIKKKCLVILMSPIFLLYRWTYFCLSEKYFEKISNLNTLYVSCIAQ